MKRHPIDVFSLIAGLFVTGVAIAALTIPTGVTIGPWVWPSVLIAGGVVVLGLVLVGARDRDDEVVTTDVDDDRSAALAAARAELDEEVPLDDQR